MSDMPPPSSSPSPGPRRQGILAWIKSKIDPAPRTTQDPLDPESAMELSGPLVSMHRYDASSGSWEHVKIRTGRLRQSMTALSAALPAAGHENPREVILSLVAEAAGARAACIWWQDAQGQELACTAFYAPPDAPADMATFRERCGEMKLARGYDLPGAVWARPEVRTVDDLPAEPDFARLEYAGAADLRGAVVVPLVSAGTCQGVLELFFDKPILMDDEAAAALKELGETMAYALTEVAANEELGE